MWPCTQFYTPKGLILSDIWARRFRPATARYPAHFSQKTITMATEVWKKDSPHCVLEENLPWEFWLQLWRCIVSRLLRRHRRIDLLPVCASSQCRFDPFPTRPFLKKKINRQYEKIVSTCFALGHIHFCQLHIEPHLPLKQVMRKSKVESQWRRKLHLQS